MRAEQETWGEMHTADVHYCFIIRLCEPAN